MQRHALFWLNDAANANKFALSLLIQTAVLLDRDLTSQSIPDPSWIGFKVVLASECFRDLCMKMSLAFALLALEQSLSAISGGKDRMPVPIALIYVSDQNRKSDSQNPLFHTSYGCKTIYISEVVHGSKNDFDRMW